MSAARGALALGLLALVAAPSCRVRRIDGKGESAGLSASAIPSAIPLVSASASAPPPTGPASAMASASASATPPPEAPPGSAVAAIGGVGSSPSLSPEIMRAVLASALRLAEEDSPMAAAAEGVAALEDNPRFPAGTGSALRADGQTVQMDAVVTDGEGRTGTVAAIERVRNPVRVALRLVATRRSMLVGSGALAFARSNGFPDFDPTTPDAMARLLGARRLLVPSYDAGPDAPADAGLEASVHDASSDAAAIAPIQPWYGPIAVLVRSADGQFAVAASSSGAPGSMVGQVGSLPVRGAAVFAGPRGAVAMSGPDDDLVRELLASRVYDRLARTQSPRDAATWALTQLGEQVMAGVVVIDKRSMHVASRGPMAWATWTPTQDQMPDLSAEADP